MWFRLGALILTLTLGLLAAPLPAEAQKATKIPRIGYLFQGRGPGGRLTDAFRQGLRELGYVEGQNLLVEYRVAEGKLERLPKLAAQLVRLNVDVIVAPATADALAARKATSTIPIVTAIVSDPVQLGLAASLARPGGNITGLTSVSTEISVKQLELLKETVPTASRVAVLVNPAQRFQAVVVKEMQTAGRAFGVQIESFEVRGPGEIEMAFAAMSTGGTGALFVPGGGMFFRHRALLVGLAAKHRLPVLYGLRQLAEAGGLMAFSANFTDQFRRAATFVDKILKGANPTDLPVEQPTRFELVINLKTAKALGLMVPPTLLIQADKVIK